MRMALWVACVLALGASAAADVPFVGPPGNWWIAMIAEGRDSGEPDCAWKFERDAITVDKARKRVRRAPLSFCEQLGPASWVCTRAAFYFLFEAKPGKLV